MHVAIDVEGPHNPITNHTINNNNNIIIINPMCETASPKLPSHHDVAEL